MGKTNLEPTTATIKAANASVDPHNDIKTGEWQLGLFSCLEHIVPNCCMACCLPCVSLAQISARLGVASYVLVLLSFLAVYAAFYALTTLYLLAVWQATADGSGGVMTIYSTDVGRSTVVVVETPVILMPACLAIFTWGVAFVSFTCFLRLKTRTRFSIPGSIVFDILATIFCGCCTIAQIASHIKSYTPSSCSFGPVDTLPVYPAQSHAVASAV